MRAAPGTSSRRQRSVQVHPGELTTVMYEFRNMQDRTMAAQAIPSYAPKQAMAHFNKLECFCFNEYTLQPGESKQWPVVFVIDPKLPKDVTTITLSYTFFEVGGKTPPAPAGGLRPTAGLARRSRGCERAGPLPSAHPAARSAKGRPMSQPDGLKEAASRPASLLQTFRAVAWSFFGIRRSAGHAQDMQKLNPVHVIVAGVISAALFVLLLVLLVHWVIGSGVAA